MRREERKRERTGETLLSVEERREKRKGNKEEEKEKNRESAGERLMQDEGRKPSHPINETRNPGDGAVGPIRNGV